MNLQIIHTESRFWVGLVGLFVFGMAYIVFKLTKGYSAGYMKAEIGDNIKATLMTIHGAGSLLLALTIPNNYLVDIDFFGRLYEQSGLWIAASIFTLLLMFLITIGTLLTVLMKGKIKQTTK